MCCVPAGVFVVCRVSRGVPECGGGTVCCVVPDYGFSCFFVCRQDAAVRVCRGDRRMYYFIYQE